MRELTRVELKLRRRRRFFRIILLIAVLTITALFMLKSDFFNVATYKVQGNSKLNSESIINASSINKGENIFKINKSQAEENIKNFPYTKNITIKRKFPRTIIFDVVERVGILQTRSISTMLLVDIEGFVLEQLDSVDENIPIIMGFDLTNIVIGDNIFLESKKEEIINFVLRSNEAELLLKSSKIDITQLDNINIELINGISVAFGTLDNVKYKLGLLNEILIDIEEKQIPCKMIIMNKGENPILVIDDKSEG